jgi:hypothetical protein
MSSYRVHFGDAALAALEQKITHRFQDAGVATLVLRFGNVIDQNAERAAWWRALAALYPLIPQGLTSVYLCRDELFVAIDGSSEPRSGVIRDALTVLGQRRPVRDVLAESVNPGLWASAIVALAQVASWLGARLVTGLAFAIAAGIYRPLRRWRAAVLHPTTVRELLGLYHPLNQRHVALAGYNTGVTHFGWKYPGRTVVSTIATGRLVRVGGRTVTVDAGVLLKRLVGELAARGKELYVVPNYSYISLGTTFMVPVHGSGTEVSTLGDTIEQVLAYDPAIDRIVRLRRSDLRFGRAIYSPRSGLLILRLRLRIRERSRYFVTRSRLESPSAGDIWQCLDDRTASNIELRKTHAAAACVEVSRYSTSPTDDRAPDDHATEIPRDAIGRLWDRIEENPVAAWLFHAFVRTFGYHVELFLNQGEFEVFWRAHRQLPLSKLQLRLVKCDGFERSPFGDGDRISIDIFMKRRDSAAFLSFLKEHLPHARFNPGKHSL